MDSPINWLGGKSLSAEKIVSLIPEHICYVECFFGGGWIFFRKPKSKVEVINDINGELINFWRIIQNQPKEFIERSKYEMYSREIHALYYKDFFEGRHQKMSDLERAFRFFYMIKSSFGSKFAGGWGYGQSRNMGNSFFNEFKIIDEVSLRLKSVQIDNKDFQSLIEDFDKEDTLHICDPPYVKADVDSQYFKSTGVNNVIGFSLHDHQRLYNTLSKIKGKFILTIDDSFFIRDRYCTGEQGSRGFWWIENEVFYSSADKNNRRHVIELIITNYDTKFIKQKNLDNENKIKKDNKEEINKNKSLMDY